jgi:hypothetical protein
VPNITITNNDLGSVALEVWGTVDGALQNVEITEQTYAAGTILSRDPVSGNLLPYAPAASAESIVDVTVDYDSVPTLEAIDMAVAVPGSLVGDIVKVTPLGSWPVGITQPQGRCLVAGTVQVRVANVTAGAVNPGSQTLRFELQHRLDPNFVLTHEVVLAASSTGPVTVLSAGKVNEQRLVIHAGTAITAAMLDQLRNRIIPVKVTQLARIDNPQA